jgi:hypothetical protein
MRTRAELGLKLRLARLRPLAVLVLGQVAEKRERLRAEVGKDRGSLSFGF